MNAALRRLRDELVWLDQAEWRAMDVTTIEAESIPIALTVRYVEQIRRERREIEMAVNMIETVLEDFE